MNSAEHNIRNREQLVGLLTELLHRDTFGALPARTQETLKTIAREHINTYVEWTMGNDMPMSVRYAASMERLTKALEGVT